MFPPISGILCNANPVSNIFATWQEVTNIDFYVIYHWLAIFALLLAATLWILYRQKSTSLLGSISNNLLIVSSGIWLLGFLIYMIGFYRPGLNFLSVIPRAIISSFKMFVVSNDLARVPSELQKDDLFLTIFSLVHFSAAFITFLFIFKMIGYKIKSSLSIITHKYFKAKGKAVHLFWGVNEASFLLAEDIARCHPNETIIFIDIDEESDSSSQKKATLSHITNTITIKDSEIERLNSIGALVDNCYNGPAGVSSSQGNDIFGVLHLKNIGTIIEKSCRTSFYFLSKNEAQNIVGALKLQQDKRLRRSTEKENIIYVHARREANNEVLDHYSQYDSKKKLTRIKIVDSAYMSITSLKQDIGALPVNCVEIDSRTGTVTSPFTAMIIGFGSTGQEAFKFLYEFAAFIGPEKKKSPFKCYAIDEKINNIAGLIKEKMPAIGKDELELIQAPMDSEPFWDKVREIACDLNYVVIALRNDSAGLSMAVNIFKHLLKVRSNSGSKLMIMVRCYDNSNVKRMKEVIKNLNKAVEGYNVEIRLFGEEKRLYCCNTILSDKTLTEAKEFNKVYENSTMNAEELWQKSFGKGESERLQTRKNMSRYHAIYDINRRIAQNISNTLHRRTKMMLMGLDEEAPEFAERLRALHNCVNSRKEGTTTYRCSGEDATLLMNIAMTEHERWIASHKLMGYTYAKESDLVKKMHKCICPWDELDEQTQSYDCNVVDTTIRMEYNGTMKEN